MATLVDTDEVASTNVDNTALAMLKLMAALGMIGVASIIGRLHRTRTTGIRSTGLVRQDRQILTNKDKLKTNKDK